MLTKIPKKNIPNKTPTEDFRNSPQLGHEAFLNSSTISLPNTRAF